VALHRPDYVRAPKIQKPSVARVIVRAIRHGDPPGRFLRKDEKTGKWFDIGDKKAAEKTSQALREKPSEEFGIGGRVGGTLLPNPDSYLAGTVLPVVTRNVTIATETTTAVADSTIVETDNSEVQKENNADSISAEV
jgi:hypothetical protein